MNVAYLEEKQGECVNVCEQMIPVETALLEETLLARTFAKRTIKPAEQRKNTFVSCSAQVPSRACLKEQAQRVSVSVSVLPVFSLVLLQVSVLTRWWRLRWASPCLHQLNTADAHIPACRTVRPEDSGPDSGSRGPGLG